MYIHWSLLKVRLIKYYQNLRISSSYSFILLSFSRLCSYKLNHFEFKQITLQQQQQEQQNVFTSKQLKENIYILKLLFFVRFGILLLLHFLLMYSMTTKRKIIAREKFI